jgi:hypothetical protein
MAIPQSAKLSGTILWSDSSLFNGFAVIGLILPTSSGVNWPELTIEPNDVKQRLPLWSTIPVKDGEFNQSLGLWFNTAINPPNSKYALWLYDLSGKRVLSPSGSGDFFTVTTNPHVITVTPPAVPSAGTTVPDPDA